MKRATLALAGLLLAGAALAQGGFVPSGTSLPTALCNESAEYTQTPPRYFLLLGGSVSGDDGAYVCTGSGWTKAFGAQVGTATHKAEMRRAAAQNVANGTPTKIAFDTETYDVGGIADAVTNDRFDIARTGYYLITASGGFENFDSPDPFFFWIYVDGAMDRRADFNRGTGTNVAAVGSAAWEIYLEAGSYVELYAQQTEGAAQNTLTSTEGAFRMTVAELSTASSEVQAKYAVAKMASDTSYGSGTPSVIAWGAESWDTDTMHDNVTNNSRLTATTAGVYSFACNLIPTATNTVDPILCIRHGGTQNIACNRVITSATQANHVGVSAIYKMAATEYVECTVDAGGATTWESDTSFFSAARIGAP